MALENDGVITPTGTGTVPNPDDATTVVQTPGHPVSTGAVPGPDPVVTTEFGALGQEPTGFAPNPEAVTVEGPYAKVLRPQPRRRADTGSVQVQTAEEPRQPRQPISSADGTFDGR
jgi:hypothetical protein